jgi:hypothetical protein
MESETQTKSQVKSVVFSNLESVKPKTLVREL